MNKGFTLIELIVVMFIIGLLSSILFLGKTTGEKKLALGRSIFQLAQDFREVQEMAMGFWQETCPGGQAFGFGIYFHRVQLPESYILFADCNNNQHKDGSDKVLREVKLEKGVQVQHVAPSPVALNIVFTPPDPKTYINTEDWGEEATISFWLESDPEQVKTVKINSAGRIEIE